MDMSTGPHFDINWMEIALTTALGCIGWFVSRTVASFEKTVGVLFKKYEGLADAHDDLRSEFDTLKGEHIATHGGRRDYDPPQRVKH